MTMLQHGLVPSTGGFRIERSLRFNSADSAYLQRTPSSAGNRQTWTWSGWIKRSKLGAMQVVFWATSGSPESGIYINANDKLVVDGAATNLRITTQVFRDVSAWYHIVVALDTTNATAGNRIKVYVNGSEVTAFDTSNNPALNDSYAVNNTVIHRIGNYVQYDALFLDAYLADVHFIDGSALTPSSFGENDTDTGVWKPKAYTGSYGTNGFKLTFSDNSGTTATTLGKDTSGNGNNWTPNNFSVTAGAGNDSLVDTPTPYGTDTGAGGEVRGNYCTLNPTAVSAISLPTISNGNLDTTSASGNYTGSVSTIAMSTGKWYWEHTATNTGTGGLNGTGIINVASLSSATTGWGFAAPTDGWMRTGTAVNNNAANSVTGLSTIANGDVINVAVDFDAGKLWFGRNGTWESSGNPATGSNATVTFTVGGKSFYAAVHGFAGSASWVGSTNFGQRPFAYTAPSGFKALCTQNLPTPTIGATATTRADDYFNTVLYTGTDNAQTITGVGFQPDFVWIKNRTAANAPKLTDAIRGAGYTLSSAETGAESNQSNQFTAFASDGFSVATNGGEFNALNKNYVAWNWKANGAGSTGHTQGSISSTASVNQTAGFSIVTYTGNGSAGATVGHGLGAVPQMIIAKTRNNLGDWPVYHVSLGNTKNLLLNTTDASTTSSSWWNNTTPTSTLVTLGNNSYINGNTYTFVMYCFAPVASYSSFGSYVGNGSSDGPMIYTGFRPKFLMIKCTSESASWQIVDAVRDTYNVAKLYLQPDNSGAEGNLTNAFDFLSNGFKVRTDNASYNRSSGSFVYAAFAEVPLKYSLAR